MDTKSLFKIEDYLKGLCDRNQLARSHGFQFCECSGIESLQGPLQKFRTASALFCVDDTNDGAVVRGQSGGFFKRRTFTVFLLHRYDGKNMEDRAEKLAICRELMRQVASKMILDSDRLLSDLIYLHTETIMCRELGQYFLNGCTGLYFMVDVSEPIDLRYDQTEWL